MGSCEESGPFGAKCITEIGINGVLAALAKVIYNAIGVRLHHGSFTVEKILNAIKEKGKEETAQKITTKQLLIE